MYMSYGAHYNAVPPTLYHQRRLQTSYIYTHLRLYIYTVMHDARAQRILDS